MQKRVNKNLQIFVNPLPQGASLPDETDIRDYMIGFDTKFEYDKEDELVIIPKNMIKMVEHSKVKLLDLQYLTKLDIERQYELIGKSYMGHISELITKIKNLEDKLEKQELHHTIELQNEKHKIELQSKEIEILNYKLKISEMQHTNINK